MTKTIKVTQDHIARGFPRNCSKCPVALAMQEALGLPMERLDVAITYYLVYPAKFPADVSSFQEFSLPSEAQQFIKAYDAAITSAEPFSFEIETPEFERELTNQ